MIHEDFKLPVVEFISRAEEIPHLTSAILYGSAITGDVSKKSDIDILLVFDCDHNPEIGKESEIAHKITSEISSKYDLGHPFSLVFLNQRNMQEIETDFLWNISKEGILIWGKPEHILAKEPHPSLKPLFLIKYSTKGLKEKDKRKLFRHLYTAKKRLLNKKEERLGPGILLIKAEKLETLKKILDDFGVKFSIKKLWGH